MSHITVRAEDAHFSDKNIYRNKNGEDRYKCFLRFAVNENFVCRNGVFTENEKYGIIKMNSERKVKM